MHHRDDTEHALGCFRYTLAIHDTGIVYQHLNLAALSLGSLKYAVCSIYLRQILGKDKGLES